MEVERAELRNPASAAQQTPHSDGRSGGCSEAGNQRWDPWGGPQDMLPPPCTCPVTRRGH